MFCRYVFSTFGFEPDSMFRAGVLAIVCLPMGYITQTCAIYCVVAVAVDRYIHVCYPFKAKVGLNHRGRREPPASMVFTRVGTKGQNWITKEVH